MRRSINSQNRLEREFREGIAFVTVCASVQFLCGCRSPTFLGILISGTTRALNTSPHPLSRDLTQDLAPRKPETSWRALPRASHRVPLSTFPFSLVSRPCEL